MVGSQIKVSWPRVVKGDRELSTIGRSQIKVSWPRMVKGDRGAQHNW